MKKVRPGTDAAAPVFQASAEDGNQPLRRLVKNSLEQYFAHLDGHETTGLFDLVMAEVEAPLLEAVLEHTRGNQTRAASVLGINRGTLRKKLRQYDLG